MEIFPAIDLIGGEVVRLTMGDYSLKSVYSADPLETANRFRETGARNLHVVDLDGARTGSPLNFPTIERLSKESGLFIEVGGGIRDEKRIKAYLDAGAGRVILGTVAVENPAFAGEMAAKYGEKIAVGIDAANGRAAVRGWMETSGTDGVALAKEIYARGVSTVIYTDISRDGTLKGANLDVYRELSQIKGLKIIASGGVTTVAEVAELKRTGIYGVIIGKAIYEGRINLAEAIVIAEGD